MPSRLITYAMNYLYKLLTGIHREVDNSPGGNGIQLFGISAEAPYVIKSHDFFGITLDDISGLVPYALCLLRYE